MGRIRKTKSWAGAVGEPIRAGGATGELRLHEFRSRIFRNTRFLRVWLPQGYDDPQNVGQRYPVLYLNDGQNLLESSSSFAGVVGGVSEIGEWRAGERR